MLTPTSDVEFFILASGDFIAVSADTWCISVSTSRYSTVVEIDTINLPTVTQEYATAADAVTEVGRLIVYLGMRFEQTWTPINNGAAHVVSLKLASARRTAEDCLELIPRAFHQWPDSISWRRRITYTNLDLLEEDLDWLIDAVGIVDDHPVLSTSVDDTDALPEALWLSAWPGNMVEVVGSSAHARDLQNQLCELMVTHQRLVELHKFYWETTFRDGSGSGTTMATDDTRRRLHVTALYHRLLDPRPMGEKLYRFITQSLLALDDKVVRAPPYDAPWVGDPTNVITADMANATMAGVSYAPVALPPPNPDPASQTPDPRNEVIAGFLREIAPEVDPDRLDWEKIRAAALADPELAQMLGVRAF